MYGTLALRPKAVDEYACLVGDEEIELMQQAAAPLRDLRVLNLSVTAFGTGVAELLHASVPLLADLGLACEWQVMRTSSEFVAVNKAMYDALGGTYVNWTSEMTDIWLRYNRMNASLLAKDYDVIIIHDPQPAAMRSFVSERGPDNAKWVMHSHLNLAGAQRDVWLLLRSHIDRFDHVVFQTPSFAPPDIRAPVSIIRPGIDPLGPRNMDLPADTLFSILTHNGVDPRRPIVCQIAPCDPASDFLGAIDACVEIWEEVGGLQLALIALTAPHDPIAHAYYDEVARRAAQVPDVHLLTGLSDIGNVEMNAFQRAASVIMQKGLRRGYGLWVADALWKARPVVVAPSPGLDEQVLDGVTGLHAHTTAEFAAALRRLLRDREEAAELARNGREHVRRNFLITRYVKDVLSLLAKLVQDNG